MAAVDWDDASTSISNLYALLALRAEDTGDAIAIHDLAAPGVTFAELRERADDVAKQLLAIGMRSGDRVAIYMEPSVEFMVSMFGAWKIGVCAIPNNSALRASELVFVFDDSEPRLLMADTANEAEARVACERAGMPIWVTKPGVSAPPLAKPSGPPLGSSDDNFIVYTSGTTGKPKGAVRTHESTIRSIKQQASGLIRKPGPLALRGPEIGPNVVCLPISNTGGFFAVLFAFWVGRSVVLMRKFNAPELVAIANAYRPTNLFMTPTMFQMLNQLPDGSTLPDSIRFAMSGGAPLPVAHAQRFEERFGIPIIQVYGQTEASFIAGGDPRDIANGTHRPGAIGKPYPGVKLSIRDEAGTELAAGGVGEIYVQTEGFVSNYLNLEDATKELIQDGWMWTGDLGYIDADGYLFLVGRKRDMMIVGGFNVYPAELEEVLSSHPDVDMVGVVAELDERLGEIPHAVFTRRSGSGLSEDDLLKFARREMAGWKAPRKATLVDEMPRLVNGKIARSELPGLIAQRGALSGSTVS